MNPISNSRRVLFAMFAIAGVLVLLATAKPAYRAVNIWRANRLVTGAEKQIANQDWLNACQSLREARVLAPENARVTRTTAQLLGKRSDPQVLALLETLIQSSDGTPQDRIDFVRLALRVGQLTVVQKHLIVLLREPQTAHRFDVLFLASDWYWRCGEHSRAIAFARKSLVQARDAQETADAKLLLAHLLLPSPSQTAVAPEAQQQAEAKQYLWELAGREDRPGLEALLVLSEVCKMASSREEAGRISERLGRHPLAGDEQRLLGLTWKLRCDPDHREQIVTDAVSAFRNGEPERLAVIGRWLNQQQESRRVVDLIPLTVARGNKDLFLVHLDALANLGQWQNLQTLLAGEAPLPVDSTIRRLYEVRTALALGREDESRQHWYDVHQSMRQADPRTVLYVAQYAERLGRRDDAAKAYRLLTGMTGAERSGYLGLIRLTEQSGETKELRDQVKELAERFPSEFEPQNDLAYLDLLLNENVTSARESAGQLVKRFPEILAYRTTLALAHLRNGDAAAARTVYREFETDWSNAQPGWHAVYAAVLAASGEQTLALAHAREISTARLRAEERALIANLGPLSAE